MVLQKHKYILISYKYFVIFLFHFFRDEKIQSKISRIINIWEERAVYDDSYLGDLTGLLTTPIQKLKLNDPVQEFQVKSYLYYILINIK